MTRSNRRSMVGQATAWLFVGFILAVISALTSAIASHFFHSKPKNPSVYDNGGDDFLRAYSRYRQVVSGIKKGSANADAWRYAMATFGRSRRA